MEMNLQGVSRLWRAMSSLRSARWFVCESAQPFEFVTRHVVGHRLQGPGVERARDSIASVGAAIQERFEMHGGDRAVFLHSSLDMHQNRMPATMTVENFFSSQRALHRPAGQH